MKVCRCCGIKKGLSDFSVDATRKDGRVAQCKACRAKVSAKRYSEKRDEILARRLPNREANRDAARAYTAAWSASNPLKRAVSREAYRARKRGADGTHTAEDVRELMRLQRGKCAVCATDIRSRFQIDHIQPLALGGSNDRLNIQLLCGACNASKGARDPIDVARRLGRLL